MRDDVKPCDSEIAFDPAHPNAGPMLSWRASQEVYALASMLGQRIALFVNSSSRGRLTLDPSMVQADLIALHCNGRPQDFQAWAGADITVQATEYSLVYNNFDRRLAKLPAYVRLRFDAQN
jgi:hypothetical protein